VNSYGVCPFVGGCVFGVRQKDGYETNAGEGYEDGPDAQEPKTSHTSIISEEYS